ncbi:MAG: hypothetical protein ACP5L4_04875 [Thermoplasmata archaeon]
MIKVGLVQFEYRHEEIVPSGLHGIYTYMSLETSDALVEKYLTYNIH